MPEIKAIDATPQRPEGNRVVDAPVLEIDLNKFMEELKDEPTWKESDRNSITIHKSASLVMVLMGLQAGAELKPHKAEGILTLQVIKGEIEFITENKKTLLSKRNMIVLHENIFHSVIALEESFVLLSIAKVKEEKE